MAAMSLEEEVVALRTALAEALAANTALQTEVPTRVAVHTVLIDTRHAPGRTVGERLRAAGAQVHALPDGDVTQVWRQRVGPAWRQQPVTIAGLTASPALFCLEELALGCGLRVVFHAEHIVHEEGRTEHRLLRGASAAGITARELPLAGLLWPSRIAQVIAAHANLPGRERFGRSWAALHPSLPPGAQLLTSWIIAAT